MDRVLDSESEGLGSVPTPYYHLTLQIANILPIWSKPPPYSETQVPH